MMRRNGHEDGIDIHGHEIKQNNGSKKSMMILLLLIDKQMKKALMNSN